MSFCNESHGKSHQVLRKAGGKSTDQYLLGLGKKCDGTVVPFIWPVLSYTLPGTSASRASYTDVDMKCVPGLAVFTSFLGFENWIKDSFRLFSGPSTRTFCSL